MTQFSGHDLHQDDKGVKTSRRWGDIGDTTEDWFGYERVADGGDVAQGAKADAAVTDPSTSGSLVSLLKGLLTNLRIHASGLMKAEDAAHTSGDAGVAVFGVRQDTVAALAGDGDYTPFSTDANGRLRVVSTRDSTDTLSLASMAASADSLVVKASPGTLHSIVGSVVAGEDGWIQIHDATAKPANGAVPELAWPVEAIANEVGINIPLPGHPCATGITLVWSTTRETLTAGGTKLFVTGYYQ